MNQINEQKLVEALSQALEPAPFLIPAGTVLFHGTPIPEKGAQIDPPRLCGDKWFTDDFGLAYDHAYKDFDNPERLPAAVFNCAVNTDLYVAREIPLDPTANEPIGAWSLVLIKSECLDAAQDVERKHVRNVLALRFNCTQKISGLLKGQELFLLDCAPLISNLVLVSHRSMKGAVPFVAEGLHPPR